MKYLLYIILSIFILTSCTNDKQHESHYRILVLHSTDSIGENGECYKQYMAEKFTDSGINADIYHFYLDIPHNPLELIIKYHGQEYMKLLKLFKPDIILIDGDEALNLITADVHNINYELAEDKNQYFHSVPMVFGGVTCLDKNEISTYPNITGFEDIIDLQRNLELYTRITGKRCPIIELDHFHLDSILRNKFAPQLNDSRFVDNSDFHIHNLCNNAINKTFKDKIVVTFISAAEPERNIDTTQTNGKVITFNTNDKLRKFSYLLYSSKDNWQIQVKNDIFNNSFIKQSNRPQFTAIRANFNNPYEARLLGGFFSSMETQVNDMVDYAVKILKGTNPKNLPIRKHVANYYLDYNVMQHWQPDKLEYSDFNSDFKIINVPIYVSHAFLFWLVCICTCIFIIVCATLGVYIMLHYQSSNEKFMDVIMHREKIRRQMVIQSQKLIYWFINGDTIKIYKGFTDKYYLPETMFLDDFGKLINQDSIISWNILTSFEIENGTNRLRLHLILSPTEEHWYEFIFNFSHDSLQTRSLMGIAIKCDQEVEEDKQLDELQNEANESALRQSLFSNISQDIQTPLNAVIGFAQLLTSNEVQFNKEEKEEFCKLLHENSNQIVQMFDEALEQSKIEIGEYKLRPIKTSAQDFINSVYKSNLIITPTHLELKTECEFDDAYVMMAPAYTLQVMNNFVSNAFKFTAHGSVEIGYHILNDEKMVMFYCKDTGMGISEENCAHIFERFYKISEKDKGTGVKLGISKTIIENEDGEIGVESKEGKGSTFWFKLKMI